MSKFDKIRLKIPEGKSDADVNFEDLRNLLISVGFVERIKGSHHSYRKEGITEKPNLQRDGSKAKSYQVRQVRDILGFAPKLLKFEFLPQNSNAGLSGDVQSSRFILNFVEVFKIMVFEEIIRQNVEQAVSRFKQTNSLFYVFYQFYLSDLIIKDH